MAYPNRNPVEGERIQDITDIEKLKKYLCPRSNQNPYICIDCKGLRNCTAGQRAVVLLDRQTDPGKAGNLNVLRARDKLKNALAQPDPVKWLMDNGTPTRHAAVEFIRTASIRYPDIATNTKAAEPGQQKDADMDDDLISISDFLKENGMQTAEKSSAAVAKGHVAPAESKAITEPDPVDQWFEAKVHGFEEEKNRLNKEKANLEEKIRAIDEQIQGINASLDAIRVVRNIHSSDVAC